MKSRRGGRKFLCPKCGGQFTLNRRGVIRSHSVDNSFMSLRRFPQCGGSFMEPFGGPLFEQAQAIARAKTG